MQENYSLMDKILSLGILGLVRLSRDLVFSAIVLNFGSIMRWPFYIRKSGSIVIGRDFRSGPGIVLDIFRKEAKLKIGHSFRASSRLHIACVSEINIGNNVLVASDVYISDHSHGSYKGGEQSSADSIVKDRDLISAPIYICDNVWIGEKVCILPGVRIGKNSIIGACSIVKDDVLPNSIYVGCPARRVKVFDEVTKSWIPVDK